MTIIHKLPYYLQLMRLDKPIGTLLLLWPTLWSLWISSIERTETDTYMSVDPYVVIVFIIGVFLMRSAGCVINDYADRDFDRHVERTKNRPLTSGLVSKSEAIGLFLILAVLSLFIVLSLNNEVRWKVLLMSVPALAVAVAYPYMKRFFVTPQLVLGIAFSFGIPMAYIAQGKGVDFGTILLMLANIAWVIAYDTAYAMVDREDDEKIGIQSSARFFGGNDRLIIGILQLVTIVLLIGVGIFYRLNGSYFFIVLASSLFFVYQQWLLMSQKRENYFKAFLNNSWFGALIFLAILIST